MFSIVNALLLRPLPYREPHRLVRVTGFYPKGALVALQQESRSMDVAGFTTESEFVLTRQGEAVRLVGSAVSADMFSLIGVRTELGRTFSAGELDSRFRGNDVTSLGAERGISLWVFSRQCKIPRRPSADGLPGMTCVLGLSQRLPWGRGWPAVGVFSSRSPAPSGAGRGGPSPAYPSPEGGFGPQGEGLWALGACSQLRPAGG
jgi:hypothetical protein